MNIVKRIKKIFPTLSRYIDIILFKTYANLKGETEKTYIGCLWWILEPILNTAVFYLVFTFVLHMRTENFTIFLYIGMVIYGYFAGAIANGASSIISHAGLMQQVYLPKPLFIFISISNLTWKFLFSLIILFPLVWWHGMPITWSYLTLPLLLFFQYLLVVGIALPLSLWIAYFQDGRTVLNTILGVGMWFSGVFYTVDKVPDAARALFYLNPAAVMIEAFRNVLLDGKLPQWEHFKGILLLGIIFWGFGLWVLYRFDRRVTKLAL